MPANGAALAQLVVLNTKAALAPVLAQQAATDVRLAQLEALLREVTALRERVAVLETRAPVPGPPGTDGVDGVGFQDLSIEFDGARTLALKFLRDGITKVFPIELTGYPLYRGQYFEGKLYASGDRVRWGGSEWHCLEPTTSKPGEGSKAWHLVVKAGRDGKDGRDGRDLTPVVKGG